MKQFRLFWCNEDAVIGLPMRLTVSVIVGIVALALILSWIMNPCLFPGRLDVSVSPVVHTLSGGSSSMTVFLDVYVRDSDGHPVKGANIIVNGLGGVGQNFTNGRGYANVSLDVSIHSSSSEGYLDVKVKSGCFNDKILDNAVKVTR